MDLERPPFSSIYRHGFARVAVCIPALRVADPAHNSARTIELAQRASAAGAVVVVFPELGISAYTCEDLFHQDALLGACEAGLAAIAAASRDLHPLLLVGAPLRVEGRLFNCAVAIHRGAVLGVIPKSYLPNYREFYERRQFAAAREGLAREITVLGQRVPFGDDLIFAASSIPDLLVHAEICEDVWVPIPPSTYAALAGATVLCNLSASNITIGKADYRKGLCAAHSGRCVAAYLYTAAGAGESTTDLAWDGHAMIYENAALLAESRRFAADEQVVLADVDLGRLVQDRLRLTSFGDAIADNRERLRGLRRIPFDLEIPDAAGLERRVDRYPFVPSDVERRDERCYEAYNIQVHGLCKRLEAARIDKLVIGVSGGLDSTQALIVAAKAMDRLGLPRSHVLAYTMPGFATSSRTYENAWKLMRALGVKAAEIDIKPSCRQMMKDIEHPFHEGEAVYDITFENVQAGERTSHLFRLANHHKAMVLGTGDLSELALGWATYGVGDHMSHYNVNASVPKTLIQYLIRWVIEAREVDPATAEVLQSIVDTEISPELIPGAEDDPDAPAQSTEAKIGPYDLQDFNTYYITRYGFPPSKVAFLALHAWSDRRRGAWPPGTPEERRRDYDLPTIKRWLEVFLYRFFQISQFKRSCVPNGPKVGSGGSLSPRGDWRAPS
ncbi:MAG: NAD(+) synthase, partial [Myxococcales bacterium]|nr:NAD(+) synthase [Myxococcales bacterium]